MKNRYLKGAHISEKKVFELLRLFCDDLNATQIAEVSGISRITVNAYLKMIRRLLAEHSEEEGRKKLAHHLAHYSTTRNGNGNHNGHLNGHHDVLSINDESENLNGHKRPMYGLNIVNTQVFATEIDDLQPEAVHDWLKKKYLPGASNHVLSRFQAIADFNSLTLYRTGVHDRTAHRDDLDQFWGMLRSRMIKFRGLNSTTLFLHVKETEFRYNNREHEMFDLLLKLIQKRPLHYSKQD